MNENRRARLKEIFLAASQQSEAERAAYLDEACDGDAELRAEVESLFEHTMHEETGSEAGFEPDEPHHGDEIAAPPMVEKIDRYTIRGIIGEGGMGTVYEAEQDSPRRTVALKVIRAGFARDSLLRRFELEAQILGKLDHPGIATIFEAGTFDGGAGPQPFFAMELVRGQPLNEYAEDRKLGTRQRLELLARIAEAVQHAHQKGVIHRDLKPSNVLVTDDGQVKILDFGVARATDADIQTATLQTDIGQLVGTVPYMSPEQACGDPDELDTRSDVYALGIVAYELLAGRLPYHIGKKMIHEAVRVICEEDPTPLSSINRVFRGDVEIIVGKALEKEKDRRYQSANDFADDIHRYLNDEPIVARPPSAWYQLNKFSKRNKALMGGLAAVLLVSIVGAIVSVTFAIGEAQQRKLAEQREQEAETARAAETERAEQLEQVARFQEQQLGGVDPDAMGLAMRDGLREKIASLSDRRRLDDAAAAAMLDEYDALVVGADFTGLALDTLDEHIFEPALAAIDREFADQPLVRARLLQTIAVTTRDAGLLDAATEPQLEALAIRRSELGDDHPETLASLGETGVLLELQGKLAEADAIMREALDRCRRVLGDEHPMTLTSINSMGSLLEKQRRLDEAEAHYREALEGRRLVLGSEHEDTLITINDMGVLLQAQGRLDDAEPYMQEAMAGYRRALGEDHPDTLVSIMNVGSLRRAQGNIEEAEPYIREAMEGFRRTLGDDHPSTLTAINNMGGVYDTQGKASEAEPYFRLALEGRRRTLGNDHPNTLISINNMGVLLRDLGQFEESEALGAEAVERSRDTLPPGHLYIGAFLRHHADALAKLERYSESEKRILEAYGYYEAAFGTTSEYTIGVAQQVIALYDAWHEVEPGAGHDSKAAEWRAKLPAGD